MSPEPTAADLVEALIGCALGELPRRPIVVGLCGAQGSGKSTLAATVAARLGAASVTTAVLSLDDLYLSRAARERLARDVHPLFATRGVPGTHDVALGLATLDALAEAGSVALPRFDKGLDAHHPDVDWPVVSEPAVVLFEGWCVGATPQPEAALVCPMNWLEALEDGDGAWRTAVNHALASTYRPLFARFDRLILLAAPDFEVVRGWRGEQEARLRKVHGADAPGVMDEATLDRFVAHYERLTRHILATVPPYADAMIPLDAERRVRR